MTEPLTPRINFAKIITILAIVFGVSLGLCGLTYAASTHVRGDGQWIIIVGLIELAAILLTAVGLVITVIVWIIASATGYRGSSNDPQKLFENSDDKEP